MISDLKYALRSLGKHRAFTLIAVSTLALGIGANTAIFSVVNGVLLRPLPYPNPDRLYQLSEARPGSDEMSIAYPNYLDWRSAQQTFEDLSAFRRDDFNLTGVGEPERLQGAFVTASYFKVIGLTPKLGRVFSEADDRSGGANVVLLSERLWRTRFGADPGIIGRDLTLNGISYEVIGVMPASLVNPSNIDLYAPFGYYANRRYLTDRGSHPGLFGIARLKEGISLAQAEADFRVICQQLEKQYPQSNAGNSVKFTRLLETTVGEYRATLWMLMGAVGFVLLIACANLANLLLARAAGRRKELAVRFALGASRRQIASQLLTESVLLAIIGGGLGLLLAVWGVEGIAHFIPRDTVRFQQVQIDGAVLLFAATISFTTGLLFGLLPAWKMSRTDRHALLQEAGHGGTTSPTAQRGQRLLVIGQIALTCLLLTGAGLLIKSFVALQKVKLGFDPNHLLTLQIKLPGLKYRDNPNGPAEMATFYRRLLEDIATVPGVRSVALSDNPPFTRAGGATQDPFAISGRPDPDPGEEPLAETQLISSDYFKTMGVALLRGRAFGPEDSLGSSKVVIIDEAFARRFFPDQDPLGQQINDVARDGPRTHFTIIGVAATVRHTDLAAGDSQLVQAYYSAAQYPSLQTTLLVRFHGDALALTRAVRNAVLAVDPTQPVFDVRSMDDRLAESLSTRRLSMVLVGLFSGLALLLAAIGIYGTLAYAVERRTREIGIRLAVGAQRPAVFRLILRQGLSLVAFGLIAGLAGALGLGQVLTTFLFGVSAHDLVTLTSVSVLLACVATLACLIPARRAMSVDPMVALRYE